MSVRSGNTPTRVLFSLWIPFRTIVPRTPVPQAHRARLKFRSNLCLFTQVFTVGTKISCARSSRTNSPEDAEGYGSATGEGHAEQAVPHPFPEANTQVSRDMEMMARQTGVPQGAGLPGRSQGVTTVPADLRREDTRNVKRGRHRLGTNDRRLRRSSGSGDGGADYATTGVTLSAPGLGVRVLNKGATKQLVLTTTAAFAQHASPRRPAAPEGSSRGERQPAVTAAYRQRARGQSNSYVDPDEEERSKAFQERFAAVVLGEGTDPSIGISWPAVRRVAQQTPLCSHPTPTAADAQSPTPKMRDNTLKSAVLTTAASQTNTAPSYAVNQLAPCSQTKPLNNLPHSKTSSPELPRMDGNSLGTSRRRRRLFLRIHSLLRRIIMLSTCKNRLRSTLTCQTATTTATYLRHRILSPVASAKTCFGAAGRGQSQIVPTAGSIALPTVGTRRGGRRMKGPER